MEPKHLSLPSLPYPQYFGGVSALTPDQYLKMNGFPNEYWGWGGEDDDIATRSDFLPPRPTPTLAWIPFSKAIPGSGPLAPPIFSSLPLHCAGSSPFALSVYRGQALRAAPHPVTL